MRITFILNEINKTTGLEKLSLAQMDYMIEVFNYDIDLILINQNSNSSHPIYKLNEFIHIHYLNIDKKGVSKFLKRISGINNKLKLINPDIVIVCIDEIFGLFLPTFVKKRQAFIYQRYSTKGLNFIPSSGKKQSFIREFVKKTLLSRAGYFYDRFVVLTEDDKADWQYLKSINVIHCANLLDAETTQKNAKLINKIIIAVGRQDYVKGYDMLLKSWQLVIKDYPDWILKCYGRIKPSLHLDEMVKELGLSNNVEFHEHTDDIVSAYLEASALVCSSRTEGFPLVFIESMSLGIPVVSFDCPNGPRAIIENMNNGILVEPNNIHALSEGLKLLISDSGLRKTMGEKAKISSKKYSLQNIMEQWRDLIEDVHDLK